MSEKEWFVIDDTANLDTPALVVYPDRVQQNIDTLKSMIDEVSRLRPHAKTHKSKQPTLLLLDAGVSKFKCATIAEAEMLAMCKAPDVLLAYQPVGPKLIRFVQLQIIYPETVFSCLVDNLEEAVAIADAAAAAGLVIPVYIDLNVGQNRTGITPEMAFDLYLTCREIPGLQIKGLHAYDGHIHDADLTIRKEKYAESFQRVAKLELTLKKNGINPIIIAGGSPTFPFHAERSNIECSPGTFIYWDRGYETGLAEQPFLPAALVIARIISLPDETKICLDVGHKSVSAENDISKRIFFLNASNLIMIGQSEEHLVAEAGKRHNFKVGDVLYGLPYHICPTVSLYERAITVHDHETTGEWLNIARDRKITV